MFILQIIPTALPGIGTLPADSTPSAPTLPVTSPTILNTDSFVSAQLPEPQNVPNDPFRDFAGDAVARLREERVLIARLNLRRDSASGRAMEQLLTVNRGGTAIAPTLNANGSYSRSGDTSQYFYQQDGSTYCTGGLFNGTPVPRATRRNGTWDSTATGQQMLSSTRGIASQDLIPNPDGTGSFTRAGEGNTGSYIIQPDGSIFYAPPPGQATGRINGVDAGAQTFVPDQNNANGGSWNAGRNTAMAGTNLIRNWRLQQTGTPRVFALVTGGRRDLVYIEENGDVVLVRSDAAVGAANRVQTSTAGGAFVNVPAADIDPANVAGRAVELRRIIGILTAPVAAPGVVPPAGPPVPN